MIAAIDSERIKLMSTRSPYWCLGIVVFLGLGFAALMGLATRTTEGAPATASESAWGSLLGINFFGGLVLMIMGVLAITSEFRFGTIRTTFQAVPKRPQVLVAKAIVYALLAGIVTLILVVLCLLLAKAIGGSMMNIDFGDAGVIRQIWGTPLVVMLYVVVAVGVGAIVRQTAGAIAIVLLWILAIETILKLLPRIGDHLVPFLPFDNATRFLQGDAGADIVDHHWNTYGSLAYFAIFAIVIFGIGIVVTERRDA